MERELNFSKQTANNGNTIYVAEVTVEASFNLHLESESAGRIEVQVKTPSSDAAYQRGAASLFLPKLPDALDCDIVGEVYPKSIKIISDVDITKGIVTEA